MEISEISSYNKERIEAIASARIPNEACGVCVAGAVIECENEHPDPSNNFQLSLDQWEAEEIDFIWHSHFQSSKDFSKQDIISCRELGIPYYLVSLPDAKTRFYDPRVVAPLVEREWTIYQNCSTLLRDVFRVDLEIEFEDYIMESEDETFLKEFDPIGSFNPREKGFRIVGYDPTDVSLQKYDVFTMRLHGQSSAAHIAMLMDVEQMHVLHHCARRLSGYTVYGGSWLHRTETVWRHQSLIN